jgi:hypothetical protein
VLYIKFEYECYIVDTLHKFGSQMEESLRRSWWLFGLCITSVGGHERAVS